MSKRPQCYSKDQNFLDEWKEGEKEKEKEKEKARTLEDPAPFFTEDLQEAVMHVLQGTDALDDPHFNAVSYINAHFPDEESLDRVEETAKKVKIRISTLDAEITAAIRRQVRQSGRQQRDRAEAKETINELFTKIQDIKRKAEQSETMVQEICSDIKMLDQAKENLSTTVTTLRRLEMLVDGVEQLQVMADKKQHRLVANLLEAVNQLLQDFRQYDHVPRIRELKTYVDTIKQQLSRQVYEEFRARMNDNGSVTHSTSAKSKEKKDSGAEDMRALEDVCFIVDAFGLKLKRDFVIWFCDRELAEYKDSFRPVSENSRLEKVDRRYTWLRNCLKVYKESWSRIFPPAWCMEEAITEEFCVTTREGLNKELEKRQGHNTLNVKTLLSALSRTIDFEKEMRAVMRKSAENFMEIPDYDFEEIHTNSDVGVVSSTTIDLSLGKEGMRRRFFARVCRHQACTKYQVEPGSGKASSLTERGGKRERVAGWSYRATTVERSSDKKRGQGVDESSEESAASLEESMYYEAKSSQEKFETLLSSCFNPYMSIYVSEVDKLMKDRVDGMITGETWKVSDDDRNRVLSSSQDMIFFFKTTMDNLTSYTTNQALFDLYRLFKKYLKLYSDTLSARLESTASGAEEEKTTLLVINTADYCSNITQQMVGTIQSKIDDAFKAGIEMETESSRFAEIVAGGVKRLIKLVMQDLQPAFDIMRAQAWETWDCVGDHSSYVSKMQTIVTKKFPLYQEWMSTIHYRFFLDTFASTFMPKISYTLYMCNRVSEVGAEQMLLDVCYIKQVISTPPCVGVSGNFRRYVKYVQQESEKVEMLLKVLITPYNSGGTSLVDTYNALVAERSEANFTKIMDMKGIKKQDQGLLLEAFRSRCISDGGPGESIIRALSPTPAEPEVDVFSRIGSRIFSSNADAASEDGILKKFLSESFT